MGVLFISPDSLLIRLADQPLEIQLFWRSLFQGIGLTLFTGFRYQLEWWKQVRQVGRAGWVVMIGLICGSTCFVLAIQHARVAHVLLLLNTTPVIAGVLSWLVLGEKINRLTWVLIGISIAGSTLIVIDSAAMGESGSSAFGLLMALGAALATAINFFGFSFSGSLRCDSRSCSRLFPAQSWIWLTRRCYFATMGKFTLVVVAGGDLSSDSLYWNSIGSTLHQCTRNKHDHASRKCIRHPASLDILA
jgi:drug/metabolite transporter (DMT)-like permease